MGLGITFKKGSTQNQGAVTLIITIILLVASTLIILFAANFARTQEKMLANMNRHNQAFEAAEAGMEYGVNYLQQNAATILASPVSGFISYTNAAITNVALSNGSQFTLSYSNPIANNYDLLQITSIGTSSDGGSTRTIKQQVQIGSLLINPGTSSLVSRGAIAMLGNATATNTTNSTTIQSGSTILLSGSAQTITSGGVSSTSSISGSDLQQNDSSLASMTQNDFFATFFGNTTNIIKNKVVNYYSNSANTNYSSTLEGKTGTSIWIDQTGGTTATLNGTTTIGSATSPVLLIVNGNLSLSGNVKIYGFVFVIGSAGITTLTGNTEIIGAMATTEALTMAGNIQITYNPTVLDNLQNLNTLSYFAKVPGSWRDF